MHIACGITKTTDMNTEYVILISFPLQHLLRDKSCAENRKTHIMFNNIFPENRDVYEIIWKNKVQPDRPGITI